MRLFFVFLSSVAIICNTSFKNVQCDQHSLSDDVEPVSYDLQITPDLTTFTFNGIAKIIFRAKFSTNVLKLHCKNFKIAKVFSQEHSDAEGNNILVEWSQTDEFCIFNSVQSFEVGSSYTAEIEYNGDLKDDTKGLFRTSYQANGKQKWLVATNFYGTYAREAFPCFDEPRFRTPFKISVARGINQKTISNMPVSEIKPHAKDKNLIWDIFEETQPIPTYLVAFMVSEYSSLLNTASECTQCTGTHSIAIHARPNIIKKAQYALTRSEKVLSGLENFIGVRYELDKLDIATIPRIQYQLADHWGLYVMREDYVIGEGKKRSHMQNVITMASMCHTFSRHWFGGQVTPVSWEYSWLTEAFAGYMEFFVTDLIQPAWKLDAVFNVEVLQSALWSELANPGALKSSKISDVQINKKYGSINYYKGASIIRMLEHMISKNSLRSAIQKYITDSKKIRNGLVTSNDLFEALKYQCDMDSPPMPPHFSIVDVMKTWTENIGYPVINVKRNIKHKNIEIEQQTYKSHQASVAAPSQEWITPITYTTESEAVFSNTAPSEWVIGDKKTELSTTIKTNDWIICNLQRSGYYRVNYDSQNWNLLTGQLEEDMNKIHVLNRAQLIDDSFTFAYEGGLSYIVPLKLAQYLAKETEIVPLLSAIFHFDMLYKKHEDTASRVFLCMYIKRILEQQIKLIGFSIKSTDSYLTKMGKPPLLLLACKIGLKICVDKALLEYNSNVDDLSNVQPDLKQVVYCTALKESQFKEKVYENLWTTYHASDIAYDKITISKALGCSRDENILKKTLSKLLDQKDVDIDEAHENYVYDSILSSSFGIASTLRFVREQIAKISQFDDDELGTLKKILGHIESKVQSIEHLRILRIINTEFTKLDRNKFADFLTILERTKISGVKLFKENNKMSDHMIPHFHDVLNIPPPKIPDRQSSSAFIPIPSLFLCLICLLGTLYYFL